MTGATASFIADAGTADGEANSVDGAEEPAEPKMLLPVSHPARPTLEIVMMPANATDFAYRRAAAAA
jgi:hypothetical protein